MLSLPLLTLLTLLTLLPLLTLFSPAAALVFPCCCAHHRCCAGRYGTLWRAAVMIQSVYRARKGREAMEAQREHMLMQWTARRLQSVWRGRKARRWGPTHQPLKPSTHQPLKP